MVKRHYGIRTPQYKLIHFYYDVDEWELYDLKKDKNEMNNVYGKKGYEKITADLNRQLNSLIDQYQDEDAKKILQDSKLQNNQKAF